MAKPKTRIEEIRARWRIVPPIKRAHGTVDSETLRIVQREQPARVVVSGFGCANVADAIEAAGSDVAWLLTRLDEFLDRYSEEHQEAVREAVAEERERCAEIADKAAGPFGGVGLIKVAADIAAEIRKAKA